MNTKILEKLIYWMTERDKIRALKDAGRPKPWTKDKILQSYRFCCVRRMDDKVSQWLLGNWYIPYRDHDNIVPAAALARYINKIESLNHIGFPESWKPKVIKRKLNEIRDNGEAVFNAAYMLRAYPGEDKITSVVDRYVQPLVDDPPPITRIKMEQCWECLLEYYGFASFMAGQVTADLRWAMTGLWGDRYKWAPIGPGSSRGMNRLHNRDINQSLSQEQFNEELSELMAVLKERIPDIMLNAPTGRLEAQDCQSVLCETDKYLRSLYGEGRPKQLYPGV